MTTSKGPEPTLEEQIQLRKVEIERLEKAFDNIEEAYGGLYLDFKRVERERDEVIERLHKLQAEVGPYDTALYMAEKIKILERNEMSHNLCVQQFEKGRNAAQSEKTQLQKWAAKHPCEVVEDGARSCTVHYEKSEWCVPCLAKDALKGDIK